MEEVGQLSLDIFQTKDAIIILAPIAGTKSSDVTVTVTEDILTIRGERLAPEFAEEKDYLTKECFWGKFSRSIVLPKNANPREIKASSKNNILEIQIPKFTEEKTKIVKINIDK